MTDSDDMPPRLLPGGIEYVYVRLAADIERRVRAGEWAPGDRLPSREEIAASYGVAERTVRRALRELQAAGLVTVMPARGAYVTWAGPGHGEGT